MTLSDIESYVDKFINKYKSDRSSEHTIASYKGTLKDLIDYIKDNYTGEFDCRTALLDYIDDLNDNYSGNTINSKRAAIRSFITYIYSRGYIADDFSSSIKNVKVEKEPYEILESNEIEIIFKYLVEELNAAEGYAVYTEARDLLLFVFLLYTGTRRSEIVQIKWEDIDFLNDTIRVRGKGSKIRVIPLRQELKQQLFMFRDLLEEMDHAGYNVKSSYIFRSEWKNKNTKEKDKPMTPKNAYNRVIKICNAVGIEDISTHSLRHTFASYGVQNNMNHVVLADILGHSKPSTTTDIYSHIINMTQKKEEMGKVKY